MGRPAKIDTPIRQRVTLPTSIATRVDLLLFSEIEGKVPRGAFSEYVERLIRQDLSNRESVKGIV